MFLIASPVGATTRYVAQTAGTFSGGTNCNGQTAITPATWNSTTEAAGDITYLCGTITGAVNSTLLTMGWSGSSGNPIQLIFDTGAVLTSTHFAAAITMSGQSWVVINGGATGTSGFVGTGTTNSFSANGIIQNTLTGSATATCIGGACTITTTGDRLINITNGSNVTVENLSLIDSFVHAPSATNCTPSCPGNSDQGAITICSGACGGGGGGSNMTVSNVFITDTITGVYYSPNNGASGLTISNVTVNNTDAGIYFAMGGGQPSYSFSGLTVNNDTVNSLANWNDWQPGQGAGPETFHHDGLIHIFLNDTNQTLTGCTIYNNLVTGDFGEGTGTRYIETYDTGSASTCNEFNDIYAPTASTNGNGFGGMYTQSDGVGAPTINSYNNTVYTNTSTNLYSLELESSTPSNIAATIENTVMVGGLSAYHFNGTTTLPTASDYNDFVLPFGNSMIDGSLSYSTLAAWKTASSLDAHSISSAPNLTSNYVPNSGSPLINAGLNLTSLCSGALVPLCSDAAGNARPSTGAWTIGALNAASGGGTGSSIGGGVKCTGGCKVQ